MAEKQEIMDMDERRNQNLMQLIRRVHGLVENPDIEKHRQSQDHIGAILSSSRDIQYRETDIDGMYGEWVSVNRAHMKKYIIMHCNGGPSLPSWLCPPPWMCFALITGWRRSIPAPQPWRMP